MRVTREWRETSSIRSNWLSGSWSSKQNIVWFLKDSQVWSFQQIIDYWFLKDSHVWSIFPWPLHGLSKVNDFQANCDCDLFSSFSGIKILKGSTVNKTTTCKSIQPYRRIYNMTNICKFVLVYAAFMLTCHLAGTNLQCFASLEFGFLSVSAN